MTRKSIYYRLLTSTIFVFIISFGVNNQANADTIKVGVSMPLTGNFAVPGTKHLEGYKTCVDVINRSGGWLDREVELVVNDNRSDTETAISQYERFINVDKVDLTFGTFSSKLTFPISPILAKYNSIHPIPSGGALRIFSQGHKNLFYFQASAAEYVGSNMVGLLNELVASEDKPTRAALVHADDFFANSIATGLLGNEVRMAAIVKAVVRQLDFFGRADDMTEPSVAVFLKPDVIQCVHFVFCFTALSDLRKSISECAKTTRNLFGKVKILFTVRAISVPTTKQSFFLTARLL